MNNGKESKKVLKKKKTLEDLLPRMDDGNVDWEVAKTRLEQNMDIAQVVFGKLPPQVIEIEEAILGACLIDTTAFPKVKAVLSAFGNPFYVDAHNAIWTAMCNLEGEFDRLTIFYELMRIQKVDTIGGNPYFLVKLTEMVASSAHVETHARIMLQTHLLRRSLVIGLKLVQDAYSTSTDPIQMIENHLQSMAKLVEFNTALRGIGMDEVMAKAANATPKSFLVGNLIKREDLAIIFSGPGSGKSIFAIQMSNDLSRGNSTFGGFLVNESGRQKILYFDFELLFSDYNSRYKDGAGQMYDFLGKDWFVRVGDEEDNPTSFAQISENMKNILIRNVEIHQPQVVVIDNITALSNGSTQDAEVARVVMDLLRDLKKRYKLTVIVLAHTPKRGDYSKPLRLEDMAGSSLIAAYADTVIGIGPSKMGNNVKYIKQVKVRSGKTVYDEDNVIQVSIEKEGAFLGYKLLEEPTGREFEHLRAVNEKVITDEDICIMVSHQKSGKSFQEIADLMDFKISRQHVHRLVKSFHEKREDRRISNETVHEKQEYCPIILSAYSDSLPDHPPVPF